MSRPRADATLNSIGDAVMSTDLAGRVTYLNLAAEAMTGWSRQAAEGRAFDEVFRIIHRDTGEVARNPISLALEQNKAVSLTPNCLLIRRDGTRAAIEDSAAPIHDRAGRLVGGVIVFRDVGAALEASRQMAHLAQHDSLTGLANRPRLLERLSEALALARRHRKPLGVLFVDIDGFKQFNDARGHAVGDEVLRAVGARLVASLRQSDTVGRLGGDEFVVVLSELERPEDVDLVMRKLSTAVAQPVRVHGDDLTVAVSIGASLYPDHGVAADALIAHADAAMYESKRAGHRGMPVVERPGVLPDAKAQWEGEGGALVPAAAAQG